MHWIWNPAWVLWACYLGNYSRFLYLHSDLFSTGAIDQLVSQYNHHGDLTFYLGHFWSLCVEEQFYLIWPLVVFTVRRRSTLRTICLCALPVTLAARIACLWLLPESWLKAEFLYRAMPLRIDALLLGGLLALCLRGEEAAAVLRAARPVLYTAAAGFLGFQVLYRLLSGTHAVYTPAAGDPVLTTLGYTLIDLSAAALILSLLSPHHRLSRMLSLQPLRALGEISYSFYVFHDLFHGVYIRIVSAFIGNRVSLEAFQCAVALVGLVATTGIAYLSFRFFEAPFLRLKSRFVP